MAAARIIELDGEPIKSKEAIRVYFQDPKRYLGMNVAITYRDQFGHLHTTSLYVREIMYVPIYGGCLVGDLNSIWLDRVTVISPIS